LFYFIKCDYKYKKREGRTQIISNIKKDKNKQKTREYQT